MCIQLINFCIKYRYSLEKVLTFLIFQEINNISTFFNLRREKDVRPDCVLKKYSELRYYS